MLVYLRVLFQLLVHQKIYYTGSCLLIEYLLVLCRDKFITECDEFSSIFDLTGDGKRKREAATKTKLDELIKNTEKLKSGDGSKSEGYYYCMS
jgi:hypothetical protein